MASIVPYEPAHEPAVRAFNRRLASGGVTYAFPETSAPAWLPPAAGERLWQDQFLALDGDVVRGGYILKHQDFVVAGDVLSIGAFQLPLSEGTIDRAFAPVGVQLLRDALRRQPLLYTLGIGSRSEAAARLLAAARFSIETVPFLFRVHHPRAFLRNIRPLRSSHLRRRALDLAAITGSGAVAIRLTHRLRSSRVGRRQVASDDLAAFDQGVNDVWAPASSAIRFGAVRDESVLARLYDRPGNRFLRVGIHDGGALRGWAVLLATRWTDHKYFGNMHVGSIVDLLAAPGYEGAVVDAAVARLEREDVDVMVTNQSFGPIREALRRSGFLVGPSNFLLAVSPALAALTGSVAENLAAFHFARGDGDGPINL